MASLLPLGHRLDVRRAKCATASEATRRSRTAYSHRLPLSLARTTQYQFSSVRMQRGQWRMMPQSWCSLAHAQSLRTVRASSQKQSPRRSLAEVRQWTWETFLAIFGPGHASYLQRPGAGEGYRHHQDRQQGQQGRSAAAGSWTHPLLTGKKALFLLFGAAFGYSKKKRFLSRCERDECGMPLLRERTVLYSERPSAADNLSLFGSSPSQEGGGGEGEKGWNEFAGVQAFLFFSFLKLGANPCRTPRLHTRMMFST